MIEWIGFDADDTLWDYEIIYHQAKHRILQILGDHYAVRFDVDSLLDQLDELEIKNIPLYGYGIKSYALSLIELLANSGPDPLEPNILINILSMIKDMLNTQFEINPHAENALSGLSRSHNLILITKGEGYEQERKIERSGLARFFTEVEVVSQKTETTYRKILKRYQIPAQSFLMVGNSLKSDILPVVKIGGSAVHIPHAQTWFHEDISEEELGTLEYAQLEDLSLLPAFVQQLAHNRTQ